MHSKRWITAIVLIPPVVLLVLWGGTILFGILALIVSTIALSEYYRIAFQVHPTPVPSFISYWGFLNGAVIILLAAYGRSSLVLLPLVINFLGMAIFSLQRFKSSQDAPQIVAKHTFGLVYIPLLIALGVMLHNTTSGPAWLLFVMGIIAMGDTGAYYIGSKFGRHKLLPAVSPKKSIEGAIGGLAANIIFAIVFEHIFLNELSLPVCVLFALVVGVLGQIGDLFESEFKRVAGVKDSGSILPGHGGFLDRIDALLFAMPVAFMFRELFLS